MLSFLVRLLANGICIVLQVGDCNRCGCNNGRLTCTDIEECEGEGDEDDEQETRCERCQDAPQRLVCGRDGRTYRSRCIAMNCSRLRDEDILEGPCSSQVSSLFLPLSLPPSLSLLPSLPLSLSLSLCYCMSAILGRILSKPESFTFAQPVCTLYPCRSGYTCVPLGGRTCLRNEGCTADERRICGTWLGVCLCMSYC